MIDSAGIVNITPGYGTSGTAAYLAGYSANSTITATWNGNVLFINDGVNAPMFLTAGSTELQLYSQFSQTLTTTAATGNGTTATLTFSPTQSTAPFAVGSQITVSAVTPTAYNGTWTVTACTTNTVSFLSTATGAQTAAGLIVPLYQWNYNPAWRSVAAGFMRLYSTPNVGSILIAGNLTAQTINNTTVNYPTTVQWSQAFGLNSGPTTWAPTATNVANQLEVPVRGPVIDGFPMNGNFYVCSYWDTVVFSPISYQGTNYPVLGVKLLNQGRGLLNENCWANADTAVYGLDARDIWVFDGSNFKSLGNQRVKDFFFANLNPAYSNRTFIINNTHKNQIEIYYADYDTPDGWPNKMLGYRYDLDVFNPPRDVSNASQATEAPIYTANVANLATRTVVYSRGVTSSHLVQKDQGTAFLTGNISTSFRKDNINLGLKYSQQSLVHRILPEIVNVDDQGLQTTGTGNITVTVGGSNSSGANVVFKPAVTMAINTQDPWIQVNQNAFRLNSIEMTNSSNVDTWQCQAVSWQFTPTEESR